jgi:hypothetical protein
VLAFFLDVQTDSEAVTSHARHADIFLLLYSKKRRPRVTWRNVIMVWPVGGQLVDIISEFNQSLIKFGVE